VGGRWKRRPAHGGIDVSAHDGYRTFGWARDMPGDDTSAVHRWGPATLINIQRAMETPKTHNILPFNI
jgi:hypothetical protein